MSVERDSVAAPVAAHMIDVDGTDRCEWYGDYWIGQVNVRKCLNVKVRLGMAHVTEPDVRPNVDG